MMTLLCLVMGISWASAQTHITGVVVSGDGGEPIMGASIIAKGTTIGTTTDAEGKFSINLPAKAKVLVFTYIGMTTQEKEAQNNMRVEMMPNEKAIEEVIVIGYGTQSAKTVTSAVSSVKGEAMKDAANVSFDQALQGRATGIQITSPAGIVGQPPIVHIRGVNSITSGTNPLYVVDGVPMISGDIALSGQANGLSDINPADILTIDVLKDAAAGAMYGSRAANGVILITTKSGSKGSAKVSYDAWVGYSSPTNLIETMNAQEYVNYKNNAVKNRFGTDNYDLTTNLETTDGTKAFNLMKDSKGNIIDSNWADCVFRNGLTQNHTVSASGGTDKAQYFISGNYVDQKGMVEGDTYDRLGLKANLNVKATDYLKIGTNFNIATSTTSAVDAARSGSNFAVGGFPRLALINAPNLPIYNEDGTPFYNEGGGLGYGANTIYSTFSNPAKLLSIGNGTDTDVDRLIANFYAELTPIKGLTLKTQYGIDNARTEDRVFWSPIHGDGFGNNGYAYNVSGSSKQWVWSNTADFKFNIGDHNFNLLAGTEASQYNFASWGIEKIDLTDIKYTDEQGPFLTVSATGDDMKSNSLLSYFGRINYDYNAKYMASVNFRRDGYSGLGKAKWGNFGGVSAAWRISNESFFEPLTDIFSDVKLKGSWGLVGNTDIGSYPAKSYFSSYYYGSNSVYQLGQIGDDNLKWESSMKYDAGLAFTLFKNISFDFDYYYTKTQDLILEVPQAPSKGIPNGSIKTNVGEMMNKGFEFTVSADVIKTKDFTWNTSFNFTTNANKVLALANGVTEILTSDESDLEYNNITVVGKSIGQLYLRPTKGIDKETGRRIFVTPKGDNVLYKFETNSYYYENGDKYTGSFEQVLAGNTLPTYFGGWNNTLTYNNFDLTIFFQFSGGNKILNGTRATTSDNRYWNNSKDVLNNYWTSNRKNATYAYPVFGDNVSNGSKFPFTDWVEDGDYCRLKNVVLGYTFDTKNWSKTIGISKLRLYLQAQNLFVITGYTGMDPEVLSNVTKYNLGAGVDKNTMPQARVLTGGVNLTF